MVPFQVVDDHNHKFTPGITFDHVLDLYVFDRELRLLVFDAIERIEVVKTSLKNVANKNRN